MCSIFSTRVCILTIHYRLEYVKAGLPCTAQMERNTMFLECGDKKRNFFFAFRIIKLKNKLLWTMRETPLMVEVLVSFFYKFRHFLISVLLI